MTILYKLECQIASFIDCLIKQSSKYICLFTLDQSLLLKLSGTQTTATLH